MNKKLFFGGEELKKGSNRQDRGVIVIEGLE